MRVEVWKSDNNKEEIHYFILDSQSEYVFGYNPKYFTAIDIECIKQMIHENSTKLQS